MAAWWQRKARRSEPESPVEEISITLSPRASAGIRLDVMRERHGDEHPDTIDAARSYGHELAADPAGKAEAARTLYWVAVQSDHTFGPDDPYTLRALYEAGEVQIGVGSLADAESLLRAALGGRDRVLGLDHPDTLRTVSTLAGVLTRLNRHAEAAALHADVEARRARGGRPDQAQDLVDRTLRADALRAAGELDRAATMFEALVADNDAMHGPGSAEAARARNNLAATLFQSGRPGEAATIFGQLLDLIGDDPGRAALAAGVRNNLATVLHGLGRYDDAERLLRDSVAYYERAESPEHAQTISTQVNLARVLAAQGRRAEARELAQPYLAILRNRLPAGHQAVTDLEAFLAEL